jgi:transposase
MPASKIVKILHNGFGIKDVILKSFDFIDNVFLFRCTLKKTIKRCSKCRSRNVQIKESKARRLRMLPLGKIKCFLEVKVHKFKCRDCCSSSWVNLPFSVGKFPMTKTFINYILSLVKLTTVKSTANFLELQWKTVKNIHKDWLTEKYQKISYKDLTYLSMDEFSIRKGHTYMTVFLDIRTGRIIYATAGRCAVDIKPFLEKLSKKARSLKAIAMDMSPPYISAIREYLPHVAIVFDRFHVVKLLNEALDKVRKQEREKYEATGEKIGKGDRFLFLRNFENLDDGERGRLKRLFEINTVLAKAHVMKEQFREFWEKPSKKEAARFLVHWIYAAVQSNIQPMVQVAFTLLTHYEGLLNYFEYPISNGQIEGTNNKIKVLKRSAYGYRDLEYFKLLLFDLHEKSTQLVG